MSFGEEDYTEDETLDGFDDVETEDVDGTEEPLINEDSLSAQRTVDEAEVVKSEVEVNPTIKGGQPKTEGSTMIELSDELKKVLAEGAKKKAAKKTATKKTATKKAAAPAVKKTAVPVTKKAAAPASASTAPAVKKTAEATTKKAAAEGSRGRGAILAGKRLIRTGKEGGIRSVGHAAEYFALIPKGPNGIKLEDYVAAGGKPGFANYFLGKGLITVR